MTARRRVHLRWNQPRRRWAFICRNHKQMSLFLQRREGRKAQQTGPGCVCVCVCVCARARARETKRKTDQSEVSVVVVVWVCVCFFLILVWELKPHLPRMPCLISRSPLRFWRSITVSSQRARYDAASPSAAVSRYLPRVLKRRREVRAGSWPLTRGTSWIRPRSAPHVYFTRFDAKSEKKESAECERDLGSTGEDYLLVVGSEPIPSPLTHTHISWSGEGIEVSLLTQREKLLTDVCLSTHSGCAALSHTHEKPWKSLCCVRQCLRAVFIFGRLKKTKPSISNPNPLLLPLSYWSSIHP